MTDQHGFDLSIPQEVLTEVRDDQRDMRARYGAATVGVDQNDPDALMRAIAEMFKTP